MKIDLKNGFFAYADDNDSELIKGYNWKMITRNENSRIRNYVVTTVRINGRSKKIWLHRLLMGNVQKGMVVDHIDGDGLDNRRSNLRVCTVSQNSMNSHTNKSGSSKYKGVSFIGAKLRFRATILKDGKSKHLGLFNNEVDAAEAYNKAAMELFGEFAKLNIIDGPTKIMYR